MDELCKRFPRVCNCPYKEDIDNDFKNGKTAYYVCQWLKKTEYSISYSALKKYYDYLVETGEIDKTVTPQPKPELKGKEAAFQKGEKLLLQCLDSIDFDGMSDNVKVQFALGMMKILYPADTGVPDAQDVEITEDEVEWINNVSNYNQ
jgi:hypothetical protein